MSVELTETLKSRLASMGVDTLWAAGSISLPIDCQFEPPCSIKWMRPEHSLAIGAFSYAVNGYFGACNIGRYVSIGEDIQAGRGDHPVDWLSTSPFQYLEASHVFSVSPSYKHADDMILLGIAGAPPGRPPTKVQAITIGNDVWIGHGAYLKPGIRIGNGAIIAARAVVTRDVPAYAVVAGNPARVKKMRFSETLIEQLELLQWWQYAVWDLQGIQFDQIEQAIDQVRERAANGVMRSYSPAFVKLASLTT